MDDIKNSDEHQPIFESVPVEQPPENQPATNQPDLQPEEVPPEVVSPETPVTTSSGPEIPSDVPPPIAEDSRTKYFFIAGGFIIFFIFLFLFFKLITNKNLKQPVKLLYWGLWEDSSVMEPLIAEYKKNNPQVTITYEKMVQADYRDKLLARSKPNTQSKVPAEAPDIFRFHNTWLPEIKDVVAPLPSTVMTNAEFEKTFYKIHQTDLKVGNYYYGLPLEIDGMVLAYNNSLFKKAGITRAPVTWDELIDMVGKLTVKSNGQLVTSGIALGTASNVDHFSDIFGLMLLQNGGDLHKLDQPEAAGALESYRKFAEEPLGQWNQSMPQSVTAFAQEKVAMILVPSWELYLIKTTNQDLDMKVAPVPSVPGSPSLSIANYWVEGVSRYSKNQLEAWKFLKFLTQKDSLTRLYELESKTRLFGEPYSRVDMAPLLAQNDYIGAVIKQANTLVSIPVISRTYDNGLNDNIVTYLENAINATTQGVGYAEALTTAKQGVDQVLNQYK